MIWLSLFLFFFFFSPPSDAVVLLGVAGADDDAGELATAVLAALVLAPALLPFFGVDGADPDNLCSIDFDRLTPSGFSVDEAAAAVPKPEPEPVAVSVVFGASLSTLVTLSYTVFSGFAMAWSTGSIALPLSSDSVGSSVPSESAAAALADTPGATPDT